MRHGKETLQGHAPRTILILIFILAGVSLAMCLNLNDSDKAFPVSTPSRLP